MSLRAVSIFSDLSGSIVVPPLGNGTGAAASNTAIINASLAQGGTVEIFYPGTFYINATLVVPSNTDFKLGQNTTLRMAPGAAQTMIVNSAYLATRAIITSLTSVGMVVTVLSASTPTVGQWVSIHGSETSGYNGVYLVQSVSAGVNFTYFAEIKPDLTTAVVSSRYTNMTWVVADTNIKVSGGLLNYDFANNPGGAGLPSSCGIIFAHIYNYEINNVRFHDIGTRCIYPFNGRQGVIKKMSCDLTRVGIQTNGAIHGLSIYDTDSSGTDDGIAIMAREDVAFPNFLLSEGDVINVRVFRSNLDHTIAHAVALYNFDQKHQMDNVIVDGVAGNCTFGVYIAGASGKLSSFQNLEIRNIKTASSDRPIWVRFCDIKRLYVSGYNAEVYTTGVAGLTIDTSATISLLEVDGFRWQPAAATDTATPILFVAGGTPVGHFVLRRFNNNTSWAPSGAAFCCAFSTVPDKWEICDSYLNAGANAVLGYVNAAGKVGSFRNCRVVTARLTNQNTTGTMNLLNIIDCRVTSSAQSVSIAAAMTVNFEGYATDGGTNWLQINGAIVVSIKGQGFNFGAMTLNLSGGPTVQVFSNEVKVDVGLLATTAGQFANHSSAVGGRNAANQQGLAVAVLGTNWYAVATGAAGINTVIV